MSGQRDTRSSGFAIFMAVIVAAGIAVSILAYTYTKPDVIQFDEKYYYPLAEAILKGSYQDGYVIRPPLYTLFLAGIFGIFGTGFAVPLLIQSLIRGGVIAGVALMGRKVASPAAGIIAALLLAAYPLMVLTYARFITEALYIPVFLLSFYYLYKAVESEQRKDAAIAGLLCGVAALVRSTSLFLTLVIGVWFLMRKSRAGRFSRRNLVSAILLVVCLFAAVSPWTVRNAVVHRAFIPIDNTSAFNLWLIISGQRIQDATPEWESWGTHGQRQTEGYRRWRAYLRDDPMFHVRRMGMVLPRLFDSRHDPATNSLSLRTVGRHNTLIPRLRAFLSILTPTVFWLIFAGGLVGVLALEPSGGRRNLILLTVVYFILVHGMTLARPRFLLPVNVLLSVYAGALIARVLPRWGSTRHSPP